MGCYLIKHTNTMRRHYFLYLILILILPLLSTSCDKDDDDPQTPIEPAITLPKEAQSFLSYYLPDSSYTKVSLTDDKNAYLVHFKANTLTLKFDIDGNWTFAESSYILPKSLLGCLPKKMQDAATRFVKADTVKVIQRKEYGYMFGLQKDTRLGYDQYGEFLGYDEKGGKNYLSSTVREFIDKYWSDVSVSSVLFNGEDYQKRYYVVYLSNSYIIKFDFNKGNWLKIESKKDPLSAEVLALVPTEVLKLAEKTFSTPIISMEVPEQGLYSFHDVKGNGFTLATEVYEGSAASSSEVLAAVQGFMTKHWGEDCKIYSYSWGSSDPGFFKYTLDNGFTLVFNKYKNWVSVESSGFEEAIPESVLKELPESVLKAVSDNFVGYPITKMEKVIEESIKLYYYITLSDRSNERFMLKISSKGELVDYTEKL